MNKLGQMIVNAVKDRGAMKDTELAVELAGTVRADGTTFVKTIGELVEKGELVEVEYIRPDAPNKIKSILFPKGTQILNPVPIPCANSEVGPCRGYKPQRGPDGDLHNGH
jgi:hypothetical protein